MQKENSTCALCSTVPCFLYILPVFSSRGTLPWDKTLSPPMPRLLSSMATVRSTFPFNPNLQHQLGYSNIIIFIFQDLLHVPWWPDVFFNVWDFSHGYTTCATAVNGSKWRKCQSIGYFVYTPITHWFLSVPDIRVVIYWCVNTSWIQSPHSRR